MRASRAIILPRRRLHTMVPSLRGRPGLMIAAFAARPTTMRMRKTRGSSPAESRERFKCVQCDRKEIKELPISSCKLLALLDRYSRSDVFSRMQSGNHPFRFAAGIVRQQDREYLEKRPRRGSAHAGVELGVPAQSTGHRRPDASVADPRFQGKCCRVSCLNITRDWDGNSSRRTTVSTAINKNCARKHSRRSIVIQASP